MSSSRRSFLRRCVHVMSPSDTNAALEESFKLRKIDPRRGAHVAIANPDDGNVDFCSACMV